MRRSVAEKRRIVERTLEPGSSVSRVAQEHGVNPNVVFHWRREFREGRFAEGGLLPVVVSSSEPPSGEAAPGAPAAIRIELPGGAVVRIEGSADPVAIQAVLRSLRA